MSVKTLDGATPLSGGKMPIMPRDTGAKMLYSKLSYPTKGGKEADEYYARTSLRRMPTKNCGILEMHGVMNLISQGQEALDFAVRSAKLAGYSDGEDTQQVGDSQWGPSGYLIASTTGTAKKTDEMMEKAGFRLLERAFNTIWDAGNAKAHPFSIWGLFLNEEAKTGKGNWKKEAFYVKHLSGGKGEKVA